MKSTWNNREGYKRTISAAFAKKHGLLREWTASERYKVYGCANPECSQIGGGHFIVRQYWDGSMGASFAYVFCSEKCAHEWEAIFLS